VNDRFFRLLDDMSLRGRWFLKGPVNQQGERVDPRIFTTGNPVDITAPLVIPLRQPGIALDFTLADFGMPVVTRTLGLKLAAVAPSELQRLPATIEGVEGEYDVVNVLAALDCLDRARSQVRYWTESDGRPGKVGKPRMITSLGIDPSRALGRHIFRILDWEVALIVSESLASALDSVSGVRLEPVL
jgi:hypothetical protein